MVETSPFNRRGVSSIHDQKANIPHASWPKKKKQKQKGYCNNSINTTTKMIHNKKKKINTLQWRKKRKTRNAKINDQKPHLKWIPGATRTPLSPTTCQNCRPNMRGAFASPTRKKSLHHYPARGKKDFPSLSNSPANERPSQLGQWEATTLETPSFCQWALHL